MRGNLIPTTVYLDKATKREVDILAATSRKPKAVIIRDALSLGLKQFNQPRANSAKVLLDLATKVREILKDEKLPKDLSEKHDYYLWEEEIKE